jgi:hypothetical protein
LAVPVGDPEADMVRVEPAPEPEPLRGETVGMAPAQEGTETSERETVTSAAAPLGQALLTVMVEVPALKSN